MRTCVLILTFYYSIINYLIFGLKSLNLTDGEKVYFFGFQYLYLNSFPLNHFTKLLESRCTLLFLFYLAQSYRLVNLELRITVFITDYWFLEYSILELLNFIFIIFTIYFWDLSFLSINPRYLLRLYLFQTLKLQLLINFFIFILQFSFCSI